MNSILRPEGDTSARSQNWLIASDLDQTLVGDNNALRLFRERLKPIRDAVYLVYVTGRSWELCPGLLTGDDPLPEPDWWITAIGTGIYRNGFAEPQWERELEQGWDVKRAAELATACPEIRPHPDQRLLTPLRVIYHLEPADSAAVMARLEKQLREEQIAAQLIFSHGIELDIVPRAANKGNALTWLMKRLGVPIDRTVACGDSGNDADMLLAAGRGIIVANAKPELLAWQRANPSPSRFLASASHAKGVVEGLEHFGIMPFLDPGQGLL